MRKQHPTKKRRAAQKQSSVYKKNDSDFKSAKELIRTLVEVASRGGGGFHHENRWAHAAEFRDRIAAEDRD